MDCASTGLAGFGGPGRGRCVELPAVLWIVNESRKPVVVILRKTDESQTISKVRCAIGAFDVHHAGAKFEPQRRVQLHRQADVIVIAQANLTDHACAARRNIGKRHLSRGLIFDGLEQLRGHPHRQTG